MRKYSTQEDIELLVKKQRDFFRTGKTLDVAWRKIQLKKLKNAILEHKQEIEEALFVDLGRTAVESYLCDIGTTVLEINEYIHGVKKWAKAEHHFSGILCFPSVSTKVYKMPYGVSLIISPFNFPILLSLGVLAASISGGNTAVIKTSSKSAESTKIIKKIIQSVFDENFVSVVDGGHDIADACLETRFDKIFYTGSPNVAIHVLEKAAKNLTSCALELGGQNGNWCIVRKDADLKDAARKIAFLKILNAGQVCININQVAVAKEIAEEFLQFIKAEFVRQIGENACNNEEYPKLISDVAYQKCEEDVLKYKERVVFGGTGNKKLRKFSPTVIYPVNIDEEIVQKELFCPILPITIFEDQKIDELIRTIEEREHGLALYVFTSNTKWAKKIMSSMQFGGGCINEVVMHLMVKGVPFNGTGHSGMGAYHGEWGFREFTYPKTVLIGRNRFNLSLREHPYSGKKAKLKLKILKFLEK
ncbi:MAG: aldehyde dehydrogenase family protein [Treponema sp.]|jgi:aldehyde dehydrogenase (NAD+)|nr:aldehyde dehydrogenase family protein [Treponema sp.]